MKIAPERILEKLARDREHRGVIALWLLLRVARAGGRAKWSELVEEFAEQRFHRELEEGDMPREKALELARQKLQRAYNRLERAGLLRKRRIQKMEGQPREVYVEMPPSARALLLTMCD